MKPNQNHSAAVDITGNDFYPRYLAAKKSIDDRASNRHVWETLRQALAQTPGREPLHILEIGAGIGTMFQRVMEQGLLSGPATYVLSDSDPGQLSEARKYLSKWAQSQDRTLTWSGVNHGRLRSAGTEVFIELIPAGAQELADPSGAPGPFHLLMAHAVLDLLDFPAILPGILQRLAQNGLAYFTCNFDGETLFLPEWDGEEKIMQGYHDAMEARLSGASRTGRRLLSFIQRPGLELLAAGSSDWVIHPRNAGYSDDERFFLHAIIETVERELSQKNILPGLAAWARLRHRQVGDGRLSFLARHIDLLARRRGVLS
jgi:SAM-dependent methyltransferase